jgi:thiol-disulfide isomerase/thioredoxin
VKILIPLFFSTWVSAAPASDTTALLQSYPAQVLRNEVVTFRPGKDLHFSLEAPQNCGAGQLTDRGTRAVQCQFTQAGAANATLNVCDDKKTFCKPVQVSLQVRTEAAANSPLLTRNQNLNHELKHSQLQGFLIGPPAEITKEAAKAGRPVFVMVSTDWCPPCNETKEFLLSTPEFKKATEKWTKVYIDGDNVMAQDWEKFVAYRYYPSFILYNSKFEEVARYTDALRVSDFVEWAKKTEGDVGAPIAELKTRVLARLDDSLAQRVKDIFSGRGGAVREQEQARLMKWALDKDDRDLIARLVDRGTYPSLAADITHYRLNVLQEAAEKNGGGDHAKEVELSQLLQDQMFKKDGWSAVLADFCHADAKACAANFTKVDERLKFLKEHPGWSEGERTAALAEEEMYLSDAYEAAGKKAEQRAIALKCVEHYERMRQLSSLKVSRSAQQGMVTCLDQAGEFARAEATLKPLVAAYPSEMTFLMRMARVLRMEKKAKPALDWAEKAEKVAYGYNWFSVEQVKAEILLDLKRTAEAKKTLDEALGQLALETDKDSRNQEVVARLRAVQAKVENSKIP